MLNNEILEELTLLLMYLTSWEEDGYVADDNGIPKEEKLKLVGKDMHSMLLIN
ncbi:MAG: hypothetical protein J6B64_01850 [Bacilli bacterium]|nr:hypothetical protein [Bacilli bacterium]MBP3921299.1 hypothetical protein [Bacilli bacterium]